MPNLLLCADVFKISLNGKEAYFANHLNLQNLQMTQRFYYPQIPLNKECYIKLTVRSNVYVGDWHFGRFSLFSYGDVVSWWRGMPGKGVQMYKRIFSTPQQLRLDLRAFIGYIMAILVSMCLCITTALLIFPAILKYFIRKIVINI